MKEIITRINRISQHNIDIGCYPSILLFGEMGELITAITDYERGRNERYDILEEVADVLITLVEYCYMQDIDLDEIRTNMLYKVKRTEERMNL